MRKHIEIILNGTTYTTNTVNLISYQKALDLQKRLVLNTQTLKDLQSSSTDNERLLLTLYNEQGEIAHLTAELLVELYGHQFTYDACLKGIDPAQLDEIITSHSRYVMGK